MKNQQPHQFPKVGVAVFILNDKNRILLMKRKGSTGEGEWAPPGGKMEAGETFLDCARKECKEEVNLSIKAVEIIGVTNDLISSQNHYITIQTRAIKWSGSAKIMEPDKCSQIGWFDLDKLPKPLFLPHKNFFKLYPDALT